MKRIWLGVALLLVAHAAFAAVQYEYIQTTRTDTDAVSATDFAARGVIDGLRSRVDFVSGNAYPPGTYAITDQAAQKIFFVDPSQKSYTELSTLAVASSIGTSRIVISNFVPVVTKLDDVREIAGIPTEHYRLVMTYDITVTFKMTLKQSVKAVIDKWTTLRFGDAADTAFAGNAMQTGNAQIDELITAEMTRIKGFPLKQTIQVTTTTRDSGKAVGSELKVPTSRTRTREMTITSIREIKPDTTAFALPVGYRRVEFAEQAPKSQMQVLSLEPASK